MHFFVVGITIETREDLINRLVTAMTTMQDTEDEEMIDQEYKTQIRSRKNKRKSSDATTSPQPTKKQKTIEKADQDADDQSTDEASGEKDSNKPVKDDLLFKSIKLQLQKLASQKNIEPTTMSTSTTTTTVNSSNNSSVAQKKEPKKFACFHCRFVTKFILTHFFNRKAHTACSNTRPCKRCLTKGLDCHEEVGTVVVLPQVANEQLSSITTLSCAIPLESKSLDKVKRYVNAVPFCNNFCLV